MPTRRLFTALPGLLALLAAAAACTTAPAATGVPAATSSRAPHQARPASRQVRAGAAAGSVTLAFAGDVHFAGRTARLLSDPATAFGPIATVLKSADFTAVNLETAVTSRGTPQPKTYHFRTVPTAFTALRDARRRPGHDGEQPCPGLRNRRPGGHAGGGQGSQVSRTWGSARTPLPRGRRT